MTTRSIRSLRIRSKLRPMGKDTPEPIAATYRTWQTLVKHYRNWAEGPRRDRYPCPVHTPWISSFDTFYEHVGGRPDPGMQFRRIDPSKTFGPGNCQWVTHPSGRGRPAKFVATIDGKTLPVKTWCSQLGVPYPTVYQRLRKGQSPEEALLVNQTVNQGAA
jgi:hypothetical protein